MTGAVASEPPTADSVVSLEVALAVEPRRLLLFGINYTPEPTGQGLNNAFVAESLAARGWTVDVVTGIPHYPSWRPEPVPPRPPGELARVVHRHHYVPSRQSALRRGAYEASWTLAALPDALRPRRIDLVVGIVPSLGGAALAAIAAARHRVPYVVLFYDLVGRAAEQSGVPGAARISRAVQRAEIRLARSARQVGVLADSFADYLVAGGVTAERVTRFRNPARLTPEGAEARVESRNAVRERLGWGRDEFVVLHSGSMGYKQGLEHVLAAAELAEGDAGLRFVFQGDGNQRRELELLARRKQLGKVQFLPLADGRDFASVLGAADAFLLNQRASVVQMSLPSKLGSYFRAGGPVVAAVDPADEARREIEAAGAGLVVLPERPRELLDAFAALRADPERARRMGESGRAYANRQLAPAAVFRGVEEIISDALMDDRRASRGRRRR